MAGTKMRLVRHPTETPDPSRLDRLEQEIIKARQYRETDNPYADLDARLDYIQSMLGQGGGPGKVDLTGELLIYNSEIVYTLDDYGNIISEVSEGDLEYSIDYIYDDGGRLIEEHTNIGKNSYRRDYFYDSNGLVAITGHRLYKGISKYYYTRVVPFMVHEDVIFNLNSYGLPLRKNVSGDVSYTVDYTYIDSLVFSEKITIGNEEYIKTFERDENGRVSKVDGYSLDILNISCGPSIALYKSTTEYQYNEIGLPILKIVTGDLEYLKRYEYSTDNLLVKEILEFDGKEYTVDYEYYGTSFVKRGAAEKEIGNILNAIFSSLRQLC